jgi:uncharacterized protein (DUF1684 family)
MNTAQRREHKLHRTKTGQQNTSYEDGATKYIIRRQEIKTNKYVKITRIYYYEKEKQFRGGISGQN